jgi:hypothetical protein
MNQHRTVTQNAAHRTDAEWIKSPGKSFEAAEERYISEYVNAFTGQVIRKSWRMTGHDWHIFDAAGNRVASAHSLTWAKMDAAALVTA